MSFYHNVSFLANNISSYFVVIVVVVVIINLTEEGQIPHWLMTGLTVLIPKNENTERPWNYRPIMHLPTIYKTITAIISKRIQNILMTDI